MSSRGTKICRGCSKELAREVLSLGNQPLSNELPMLGTKEIDSVFPLELRICNNCGLGQVGEFVSPKEIFSNYTYFSSTSKTWLSHASAFAQQVSKQMLLNSDDLVVEIASNDGYLLQYFKELGCQVLGIEPAENVALVANLKGIKTEVAFFGKNTAENLIQRNLIPKLVVCNNVMAHVPDLTDFIEGLALLIEAGAVVSVEAPSLKIMLRDNLFDTIYHEHFSYLSAISVDFLTSNFNVQLFNIEKIPTHGGSYRYWLGNMNLKKSKNVDDAKDEEREFGLLKDSVHEDFSRNSINAISNFTKWCRSQKYPLVGYGAAAKATVLLNASGISFGEIEAIVDNSPSKQNRMVPGVRIPILDAKEVFSNAKGNLVIFPWNIANEIALSIENDFPEFTGEVWAPLPKLNRIQI
jgi:hypothetical protein